MNNNNNNKLDKHKVEQNVYKQDKTWSGLQEILWPVLVER
jgi:hypothetical protein